MKKILVVFLAFSLIMAPISAATAKTGAENRSYIGIGVGYSGLHDSLVTALAKAIAVAFGVAFTLGAVVPDVEIVNENTLPLGLDGYFEITSDFSIGASAGCALAFTTEGIAPAPYADIQFYGRLPGGEKGDFLIGGGVTTMGIIKPESGLYGQLSPDFAMRYQLDVAEHLGWYVDMLIGWNAFSYGEGSFTFNASAPSFTHTFRTGLSFAF